MIGRRVLAVALSFASISLLRPAPAHATGRAVVQAEVEVPVAQLRHGCRSKTSRKFDDIRVSVDRSALAPTVTSDREPRASLSPGILLRVGEVLCLRVAWQGARAQSFQLLEAAPFQEQVAVALVRQGDRTTLVVESADDVSFRIGGFLGGSGNVVETGRQHAGTDDPYVHSYKGDLEYLFLYDLERGARFAPPPVRRSFLGLTLVAGLSHTNLRRLNDEFRAQGFGAVSPWQPSLGLALDAVMPRAYFDVDLAFGLHRAGTDAPDVSQFHFAMHIGPTLLHTGRFFMAPSLGLAGGDIGVRLDRRRPALFADRDAQIQNRRLVKGLSWFIPAVNVGYRLPMTDTVGVYVLGRVGYQQQLSQGNWTFPEPNGEDFGRAPRVDTSGFYSRLGVGLYGL